MSAPMLWMKLDKLEGLGTELLEEIARDVNTGKSSIIAIVETLEVYLTGEDDSLRGRALELIGRLVVMMDENKLRNGEAALLGKYIWERTVAGEEYIKLKKRVIDSLIDRGLLTKEEIIETIKKTPKDIYRKENERAMIWVYKHMKRIAEEYNVGRVEEITNVLVELMRETKTYNGVVAGVETALEIAKINEIKESREKLFNSVFRYFPASFINPKPSKENEAGALNKDKLMNLLIEFARSSQFFGNLVIPMCLSKLSSTSILTKVDCLTMISETLPFYGHEMVFPFSDNISHHLIDEIINCASPKTMELSGNALRKLSVCLSQGTGRMSELYFQFIYYTVDHCSQLLFDPHQKYADPSSFALLSLASSTPRAYKYVADNISKSLCEVLKTDAKLSPNPITWLKFYLNMIILDKKGVDITHSGENARLLRKEEIREITDKLIINDNTDLQIKITAINLLSEIATWKGATNDDEVKKIVCMLSEKLLVCDDKHTKTIICKHLHSISLENHEIVLDIVVRRFLDLIHDETNEEYFSDLRNTLFYTAKIALEKHIFPVVLAHFIENIVTFIDRERVELVLILLNGVTELLEGATGEREMIATVFSHMIELIACIKRNACMWNDANHGAITSVKKCLEALNRKLEREKQAELIDLIVEGSDRKEAVEKSIKETPVILTSLISSCEYDLQMKVEARTIMWAVLNEFSGKSKVIGGEVEEILRETIFLIMNKFKMGEMIDGLEGELRKTYDGQGDMMRYYQVMSEMYFGEASKNGGRSIERASEAIVRGIESAYKKGEKEEMRRNIIFRITNKCYVEEIRTNKSVRINMENVEGIIVKVIERMTRATNGVEVEGEEIKIEVIPTLMNYGGIVKRVNEIDVVRYILMALDEEEIAMKEAGVQAISTIMKGECEKTTAVQRARNKERDSEIVRKLLEVAKCRDGRYMNEGIKMRIMAIDVVIEMGKELGESNIQLKREITIGMRQALDDPKRAVRMKAREAVERMRTHTISNYTGRS